MSEHSKFFQRIFLPIETTREDLEARLDVLKRDGLTTAAAEVQRQIDRMGND